MQIDTTVNKKQSSQMLEKSADSPIKGRRDLQFSHFSRRYRTKLSDSDTFHVRFNSDSGLAGVAFFDGSL